MEKEGDRLEILKDYKQIWNGIVMYGNRILIPAVLRHKVLSKLHRAHPG